jgi:hypothetical protein
MFLARYSQYEITALVYLTTLDEIRYSGYAYANSRQANLILTRIIPIYVMQQTNDSLQNIT